MNILISGGAGYIGSTIASACVDAGMTPIILDDLSTGVEQFARGRTFYRGDIADGALIDRIAEECGGIDAVVHCAARIVVPDSMAFPLHYYDNNVAKTIAFLGHAVRNGVDRFVFSSTASLYTPGPDLMVDEESPLAPASPYARSKMQVEEVLRDVASSSALRVIALRYFNPIGADPRMRSGLQLMEPSHALGRLIVARDIDAPFTVTGTTWPTRDGSGLRDYVHVWDLAEAHVRALVAFDRIFSAGGTGGFETINLGTGEGTTVFELVRAFEQVTGARLDVRTGPSRPGDSVGSAARVDKAANVLGWRSRFTVSDGIRHALEWAQLLPEVLQTDQLHADRAHESTA